MTISFDLIQKKIYSFLFYSISFFWPFLNAALETGLPQSFSISFRLQPSGTIFFYFILNRNDNVVQTCIMMAKGEP